jgi:ABC-2 type transport system ATP-binding protein
MTELAIQIEGVDKAYRYFQLRDIRLELPPGQILGFVGPNGAGKSTTIRILMALVHQDRGEVRVLGRSMPRERARREARRRLHVGGHAPSRASDARLAHEVRRLRASPLGP